MNSVIESYEHAKEEDRLKRDYARKTEFIITTKVMDALLEGEHLKVLDLAAGTGAYSFYLADKGYDVTAVDITPRHIDYIQRENEQRLHKVKAFTGDACNLSRFSKDTFDVVLNMGAYYHLPDQEKRNQAMKESIRVLKKGGILFTSYISRYFAAQFAAAESGNYLENGLVEQVLQSGEVRESEGKKFWTDAYYATSEEMETIYKKNELEVLDHFAQDGVLPMISSKADVWTERQFHLWIDSFYKICREKSILGSSNHAVIIGRKC